MHHRAERNNKLKKLFLKIKKKEKGVDEFVATIICIPIIATLMVTMLVMFKNNIRITEVERVHRQYLLSMEHEGFLTPALETGLRNSLQTLGVTNIDLTGSSMTEVGYGNTVRLRVECDVVVNTMIVQRILGEVHNGTQHMVIDRTASAFY